MLTLALADVSPMLLYQGTKVNPLKSDPSNTVIMDQDLL